jgi:DNA-binding NarL/FixJ family response regulator
LSQTELGAQSEIDKDENVIRVFVLDDHEVVRRGLRELLEAEDDIEVVGEAATAADALIRIPLARPDVAVLDIRLPDGDGIEVCREIRSQVGAPSCVMLTSFADDEALMAAVVAGASGYVLKEIRGGDLVVSIRKVAAGESLLDPAVSRRVIERLRSGPPEDERLSRLSDQERRVLALITEGLTNRQIGEQLFLAEKTIKNYVSNVLAKLGLQRRTEAAVFALRAEQHPSPPR